MLVFQTPNVLNIHHGFNFRDLGGYKTMDGHQLRTHKLIRSGRMNDLSQRDLDFLTDYGVTIDLDLRAPEETQAAPDRVPTNARYDATPALPTDETLVSADVRELRASYRTDPLAGFKNMLHTYEDLVTTPTAQHAYRHLFDLMLANDQPDQALLFHCAAGKDRTGMGTVYILTVLGVDDVTIRQDYLASNNYLMGEQLRMATEAAVDGTPALVATTRSLCQVTNEYLDSALFRIRRDYGTLPAYLKEALALSDDQQRDLQRLYLTDGPGEV